MSIAYYLLSLADFGLFILAGLVQIIIYPSFQKIDRKKLIQWHNKYQKLIGVFVIPLMLSELFLSSYIAYHQFNTFSLIHLGILMIIWASTFFQAVPVHRRIEKYEGKEEDLKKLVSANRLRTFLWALAFILSFLSTLENIMSLQSVGIS